MARLGGEASRMKAKAFTLIELLFGISLFSVVLTFAAMALNVSGSAIRASKSHLPSEMKLQNAVDSVSRLVRQAADVSALGDNGLSLKQWYGKPKTVTFLSNTLSQDGNALQGDLLSVNFKIVPADLVNGPLVKVVTIFASVHSQDTSAPKTLFGSVSLRDVPAGSPPPLFLPLPPSQPVSSSPSPEQMPTSPPPPVKAPPPPPPPPTPPIKLPAPRVNCGWRAILCGGEFPPCPGGHAWCL